MTVFVVFGDYSQKVTDYLSKEFDVVGYERTLESACVVIKKYTDKPDTFLILGSALVTGFTDGSINYGTVLLSNLKELRVTCPKSSIKVLLPEKTGEELIESIVSLGIYDIYKLNQIKLDELKVILNTKKTIADYSNSINTIKQTQGISIKDKNVEIVNEDDKEEHTSFLDRIKSSRLTDSTRTFKNLFYHKKQKENIKPNIKPDEDFNYEVTPSNESSKKTIKDLTTYIKVPSIKVPKMKAGNRFKKNDYKLKNLVIAVTSPWIPNIGTTRLAISLSNKLNSNIIDADLAGKGVGIRLGVPLENTWEYDWRNDTGPVLLEGNRTAWTLDPYIENSDESLLLPLHETIYQIQSAGNLVIDAGSDPLAWYAQEVFKVCDVVCVVISADPLHIARSLPKWRQLAPITKPIVAALVTEGDTNEVVKEYGVECVHTPGAVNNVSKLVTLIHQSISSAEKYTS